MIIAIISRKGGVGKTTSVVSLAAALSSAGDRTLVVDLDSQASASLSLGVERADLAPSASELLMGKLPAEQIVRQTMMPGLDLITASVDLASADVDMAQLRHREAYLRVRLEPLREQYQWILLDCPGSLSVVSQNALVASDAFLVPVLPHYLSVEGLDLLLACAERLRWRYGRPQRHLGLLLTMVDQRTKAAREHTQKLRDRYGDLVFTAEVPFNIKLAEAPQGGQTIFAFHPVATGAAAYRQAADELVERALRPRPAAESRPAASASSPDQSATSPDRPVGQSVGE